MDIVLQAIKYFLNTLMYLILTYCFLPFKLKIKEVITLFGIILINVVIISEIGNFAVVVLLISVSAYIAVIRKNRVVNILSFIVAYLFMAILDPIISLLWNAYICPISTLLENILYYDLYMITLVIILLLIAPLVGKYFHILLTKIQNQITKQLLSLIASNLGICLLIFLFNIFIGEYIGYTPEIIGFNCILFSCYFIISTILIINITKQNEKRMKLEKRQEVYQRLQEYTTQVEHMYSALRSFKHDYSNIMLTMSDYIASKDIEGLQQYFEKSIMPMNQKLTEDTSRMNQLMNVKDLELKSLLSAKLLYALELGIQVEIEILQEIAHVKMDMIDLARILGIFLDNATEATLETEQPKLQFAAIRSENEKVFIIANTFVDKGIPIATLKEEGISTKGGGRGIGLFHVKEVVAGYPNVLWDMEVKEEYFVQTLKIREI